MRSAVQNHRTWSAAEPAGVPAMLKKLSASEALLSRDCTLLREQI